MIYKRLAYLEDDSVEAVWLEIKLKRNRLICVAFIYQNPARKKVDWIDRFSTMMDPAPIDTTELFLLGDVNVDLMKPQNLWIEKTSTYNLTQLIDTPTRITSTSKTLTDHICAIEKHNICELCVPVYVCSDHLPICLAWNKRKRVKFFFF